MNKITLEQMVQALDPEQSEYKSHLASAYLFNAIAKGCSYQNFRELYLEVLAIETKPNDKDK
ncbi:hypothetical protein [Leptospira levettii]|uniref:hypothetical protein n=1 Tax=Leptospira levettii TaxID=2023178 RepID=UPI000C2AE9D3|nr:hypothetical protein [Leptospira levettii]PJZ89515.1 hypothetical protein CH368_06035 [Leptospira levettii]